MRVGVNNCYIKIVLIQHQAKGINTKLIKFLYGTKLGGTANIGKA